MLVQNIRPTTKSGTINTVKDLGQCFNQRLTKGYNEVILVFDTYTPDSLKKTRHRRRRGKATINYHIVDDTQIKHIPLPRFLSYDQTKADITEYLA